jgi:hypothetical protein
LAVYGPQRLPPLQRSKDRLKGPLNVPIDLLIAEASQSVAAIMKELLSCSIPMTFIVGRMGSAVDLDDKLFLAANEVSEIGADRFLPDELESAEEAVSNPTPKLAFSLGLALT